MWTEKKKEIQRHQKQKTIPTEQKIKYQRLSHEITGLLAASFVISLFLFEFLSLTAEHIAAVYLDTAGTLLNEGQEMTLNLWITNVSLITSVLFFLMLFLFLLGQKLSYIKSLIHGVEAMRTSRMDFLIPLEGRNELTQLAETINYLSAAEKELKEKEKSLNEEKDNLIRTLSHDIRTPLTSILSYSQILAAEENFSPEKQREYLELIQRKAEQIRELTDILLDGGKRETEFFEDAKFLMEQLAAEFEELLEEEFLIEIDLTRCVSFSGNFDLRELHRIFDNLISNVQKYADTQQPVKLLIDSENPLLIIRQENKKRLITDHTESYRIGLSSIRRIAQSCGGRVEIDQDESRFSIMIFLSAE